MARPIKESLSYFPLDTGFFGDRKIKRLLKTFGGKGTTIYIFLLCEIYRENGYFLTWDDHYPEDIADALGAGFSPSLVSEVLSLCLKIDLLDNKLFGSFSILTSAGIQKRYVSAKETINRKPYEPDELLIPEYNLTSEISGSLTTLNPVKRRKTSLTAVTTLKGNERKVKERKVKEEEEGAPQNLSQSTGAKKSASSSSSSSSSSPPLLLSPEKPIQTNIIDVSDLFPEHEQPESHAPGGALYEPLRRALGKISVSPEEIMIGQQLLQAQCTLEDIETARKEKKKNNLKYLRNIVCEVRDKRLARKEAGEFEPEIY